jgi:hypothetical protein
VPGWLIGVIVGAAVGGVLVIVLVVVAVKKLAGKASAAVAPGGSVTPPGLPELLRNGGSTEASRALAA